MTNGLPGLVLALLMGLGAGAAAADDLVGTVEKLDANSRSIWIGGVAYQIEADSTPLAFDDVKVGDKVRLTFERTGTGNVATAMAPAK